MLTAPPIVPGIPDNSSKPEISFFRHICASFESLYPPPTYILYFSPFCFISIYSICIVNVIPFIPPSNTKILLPFPSIVTGISFSFAIFSISFSSSFVFIFIKHSAGPPILNVVCFFISSLYKILSFGIVKFEFSNIFLIFNFPLPFQFSILYHFSAKNTSLIWLIGDRFALPIFG